MGRSVSTPSNAQVVVYAHTENSYYCRTCAHCREEETEAEAGKPCPRCEAANRIEDIQYDEDTTRDNWNADIGNLLYSLRAAFPSLHPTDRWIGREDRVIAENALACVTVSEYCGLVAVCLVPDAYDRGDRNADAPRSIHWIDQVEAKFRKIVADTFGIELRKMGTASNGEAFFERVAA